MAVNKDTIRNLAGLDSRGAPVVSLYLDVDGSSRVRPGDYQRQLERLVRQAGGPGNAAMGRPEGGPASTAEVSEDLERIRAYVRGGLDRSGVRGLAIFSCSAIGLWEIIDLPVPVRDQLVVNQSPQLAQLELLCEQHGRFAVLLADRQRAKVMVVEMGETVRSEERFDALPRHEDEGGDWDRDHVHHHQAAATQHHLRRAAALAFSVFQDDGFDHLILGTPEEMARDTERELHSYLRERVVAARPIPLTARDNDVRQVVEEVEAELRRSQETAVVTELREALATGRGVAGLVPVLAALVERRVATLVVSAGFAAPGWRCPACAHLAGVGRGCPVCPSDMDQVDDVVEEAVDLTLSRAGRVVSCRDNADLDVLGRIGALLRY